jgi:hypothetical protein
MAYIGNGDSGIVIDAILTRLGRQKLAEGRGDFKITQFALADDEIDYSLFNPDHPNGSAYYDIAITSLPITEAVPDETQSMKSKLVTLPRKTNRIPRVSVPQTSVTLNPGQSLTITPQTINYTLGNTTFGYTFTLADSDVCSMYVGEIAPGQQYSGTGAITSSPQSQSEIGASMTLTGKSVVITANMLQLAAKSTTLTIEGVETGGAVVVNITVKKVTTNTTPNVPLTGNAPISLP